MIPTHHLKDTAGVYYLGFLLLRLSSSSELSSPINSPLHKVRTSPIHIMWSIKQIKWRHVNRTRAETFRTYLCLSIPSTFKRNFIIGFFWQCNYQISFFLYRLSFTNIILFSLSNRFHV